MLLLSREEIRSVLSMKDAINAVQEAFREFARGTVKMPVRLSVSVEDYKGVMLTMPAYIGGAFDVLGQKVVTVYPENQEKHKLPTILATVQLERRLRRFTVANTSRLQDWASRRGK
jgi:ornithine cyclodeaminase/alanine dehydrogenase-like protein (mu-crystallin family)